MAELAEIDSVQAQVVEGPVIWNEDVDKALVPSATLDGIVSWFETVTA